MSRGSDFAHSLRPMTGFTRTLKIIRDQASDTLIVKIGAKHILAHFFSSYYFFEFMDPLTRHFKSLRLKGILPRQALINADNAVGHQFQTPLRPKPVLSRWDEGDENLPLPKSLPKRIPSDGGRDSNAIFHGKGLANIHTQTKSSI